MGENHPSKNEMERTMLGYSESHNSHHGPWALRARGAIIRDKKWLCHYFENMQLPWSSLATTWPFRRTENCMPTLADLNTMFAGLNTILALTAMQETEEKLWHKPCVEVQVQVGCLIFVMYYSYPCSQALSFCHGSVRASWPHTPGITHALQLRPAHSLKR